MVKRLLLTVFLGAFLISGCAHSMGNPNVANVERDHLITKGTTTKNDLIAALGKPDYTHPEKDGYETWRYMYSHSETNAISHVPVVGMFAGKTDSESNHLKVLINADGIVENYTYQERNVTMRAGGLVREER